MQRQTANTLLCSSFYQEERESGNNINAVISARVPALGMYYGPRHGGSQHHRRRWSQRRSRSSTDTASPRNLGQTTASVTHSSYPSCCQSGETRSTHIPLQRPGDWWREGAACRYCAPGTKHRLGQVTRGDHTCSVDPAGHEPAAMSPTAPPSGPHHSQGCAPRHTASSPRPGTAADWHNPTACQTTLPWRCRARTTPQQPALSCSITRVFRYASFSHSHSSKWLPAEWGEDKFTTC